MAAAAALAGSVAAQLTPNAYIEFVPTSSSESVSYTTITVDTCDSAMPETMVTVIGTTSVTYCPQCESAPTHAPTSKKPGHTTVYETEYISLCPTGTVPVTYTVTESCEEETPTWTPGHDHIPPGFTTTVKQCTKGCDGGSPETPVPVTITEPCDCEATSGTPLPPKPTGTPVSQIPDGKSPPPLPSSHTTNVPSGQIQAPGPSPTGPKPPAETSPADEPCDGTSCGGSGDGNVPPKPSDDTPVRPPYPTTTHAECPGPECNAHATGTMPAPAPTTPGSPEIPAYDGAASSLKICGLLSVVAVFVGGMAVFL